nr:PREDICTED: ceramide kinase-like [Latimeria chalumnae]|eukprot:XP_014350339.1 PREDICTED: ceramide kinase-like [Latimeria chalumnae]
MNNFRSLLRVKKKSYEVSLTGNYLEWAELDKSRKARLGRTTSIPVTEIINVKEGMVDILRQISVMAEDIFTVFYVKRVKGQRWVLNSSVFTAEDAQLTQKWIRHLQDRIKYYGGARPKRLLVYINPFGGRCRGQRIFDTKIAPLFRLAGISTQVVETDRANHARDHIMEADLEGIDGLVCVGGDGMFSELMHGLIGRSQKEAGICVDDPNAELSASHLRIGIIPAGSTDCICFATVGVNDPMTSALHIIVGDTQPLDVCSVHHQNQPVRYSVSLVGYGFFGDVLKDSDKHRWMGPIRYDYSGLLVLLLVVVVVGFGVRQGVPLYQLCLTNSEISGSFSGVKTFLSNKSYEGKVEFQVVKNVQSNPRDNTRCRSGCLICSESTSRLKLDSEDWSDASSWFTGSSTNGDDWLSVDGRFMAINMTCISSACPKSPDGLSPSAHLADGTADLILVRKCSRFNFLRYLKRHTNKNDQFDLPFVDVYRVKTLWFTPKYHEEEELGSVSDRKSFFGRLCRDSPAHSCWNCDGEVLPYSTISIRVHCQLIKLFARGIEDRQTGSPLSISAASCF